VTPVAEINLIASRELRKNIRSVKGIVLAILTLLGGSLVAFVMALLEEIDRSDLAKKMSPEDIHEVKVQTFTKMFHDADMGRSFADAPFVLLPVLAVTIWLTPMLVALMGFDSISGDLQHKSVRYWSLRTRRVSYFVGKWLGLWATVSTVTLLLDVIVWIACIARGQATFGATLSWGLRFWLTTLPMSAVWCGIAVLVSSSFRTPLIALLVIFVSFAFLWALYGAGLIGYVKEITWLEKLVFVYPNNYDSFFLHPQAHRVLTGIGVCFGMAAAYVGIGSWLFAKRDV